MTDQAVRTPRLGRPVWMLGGAQALYFSVVSVDLTVTALAGLALAPNPALATLPLAAINITGALLSYVTGRLAGIFGYRPVLVTSGLIAVLGGMLSALAMITGSFWLLCVGTALVGAYRAAGNFVRYWAADHAEEQAKPRALAVLMYGGLVAAFVGPLAAAFLADAFSPEYLASFVFVSLLSLGAVAVFLRVPHAKVEKDPETDRPLEPMAFGDVTRRRELWLGILTLAASGWMMTMVMAVGPLASQGAGHTLAFNGVMIQLHLIGMFAPSIVSAWVLARLGAAWTGALGCLVTMAGAVAGILGDSHAAMLVALTCSGIGWNFMFLAGTTLVVSTYPTGRGAKIQAVTEGVASATGVLAALSAGLVYQLLGWSDVNVPVLVLTLLIGTLLVLLRRRAPDRTADDPVSS